MKIIVKLYGTLREKFSDYQHSHGMELELPDGSLVKDLLVNLKIAESQGAVVSMNNRILKSNDQIQENGEIQIFQAVHSG